MDYSLRAAISQFRDTLRRGREVLKTMRKNWGQSGDRRSRIDFQLGPKEKQALKLAEIREALVAAGYNTTAGRSSRGRPKHGLVVA